MWRAKTGAHIEHTGADRFTNSATVWGGQLAALALQISTADAIIATQAITNDAELVHKDPEFEAIVGLHQQQLPYKTKSGRRSYHKLEKSGSRFIPD